MVFDDNPRRDSLIFSVHLWNALGTDPTTMAEVFNRQKDVQYSSRIGSQIGRQAQIHQLRHIIMQLESQLPEALREDPEVKELASYGCRTRMHIVRLLAPQLDRETHTKDADFSAASLRQRWNAGYADARAAVERGAWREEHDPLAGLILHE